MRTEITTAELKTFPLFAGLQDHDLQGLTTVLERRCIAKNRLVVRSDEDGQFMMLVLSGRLRVNLAGAGGREHIVDILGPGDFFGELAILTGEPRSADVQAAEESVVFVLAQQDFEKYVLGNACLSRSLLRELALRLRRTTEKMGDLALLDVYRRVARVLRSLGREEAGENGKVYILEKRPTHRELAALAGTTREMVTRSLKELEDAGHLKVKGKYLTLVSLPI